MTNSMKVAAVIALSCAGLAWSQAAQAEESLAGRWQDDERSVVMTFVKGPDGLWSAQAVSSPRPTEVGKVVYRGLTFDAATQTWAGELIKPEEGQVAKVTLKIVSPNKMEAVARVFIFSKTLTLTRQ